MAETLDAEGRILGRLASRIAETLKDGGDVEVVNAENAVVSGDPENVFQKYRERREGGTRESGPRFPKAPERILKRTVRGMLPDNADGRQAFKRLKTYRGNPDDAETVEADIKTVDDLQRRENVTLEEISHNI